METQKQLSERDLALELILSQGNKISNQVKDAIHASLLTDGSTIGGFLNNMRDLNRRGFTTNKRFYTIVTKYSRITSLLEKLDSANYNMGYCDRFYFSEDTEMYRLIQRWSEWGSINWTTSLDAEITEFVI